MPRVAVFPGSRSRAGAWWPGGGGAKRLGLCCELEGRAVQDCLLHTSSRGSSFLLNSWGRNLLVKLYFVGIIILQSWEGGRRAVLNSKHAPSVPPKGFVCSSLLLLCPKSLLCWFLEIHGIHPEPAGRVLLSELGRESASLGSLAQQPTPTCCFLVFLETSLFAAPASNNESKSALGAKTRGGSGWSAGWAVLWPSMTSLSVPWVYFCFFSCLY